ncbi:MAG: hypothetical protein M3311_06550 [Thermoproteota archaeon]|jgi:hypothetical protein|nr:hypothetical protein [Thermoproteota archaeon]
MTEKLDTVLEKISTIPDPANSSLIREFYQFMTDNRKSDSYKKNNLKALMLFSHELAPNVIFYDIQEKGKILEFLNKKIKPNELEIHTGREHQGRGT